MGFSVSASTAIVFAGMFLAVGILYPAASNGFEQVQDAQVERDQSQLDLRNTAIELADTGDGDINVDNTGSTALKISEVDVIVDGEYQSRDDDIDDIDDIRVADANGDTDLWLPGERLEIDVSDSSGDFRVVTEHGITVSGEF